MNWNRVSLILSKKNIVYRWSTCSRATCQCDMKIKCWSRRLKSTRRSWLRKWSLKRIWKAISCISRRTCIRLLKQRCIWRCITSDRMFKQSFTITAFMRRLMPSTACLSFPMHWQKWTLPLVRFRSCLMEHRERTGSIETLINIWAIIVQYF